VDQDDVIGKCLLLELIDNAKITQADLCAKTGISKQQLNKYIHHGTKMTLSTARIISKALNCKIEDLYDWKI